MLCNEATGMRGSRGLPDKAVRCLVWLCLFLTLSPQFVVAAKDPIPTALPVVSNITGAVTVRGRDGVSRDVISSSIIHSGDTLITGVDSLAVVDLADVGSIRVGPASSATTSASSDRLTLNISSGSACAQAITRGVEVQAGGLALDAADNAAIFSLIREANATTIAVYQGSVAASRFANGVRKSVTLTEGQAAVASGSEMPQQVAIATVQASFAALKCPADDIIARVVPTPTPAPGGGHGGGGGIIGILLGLGAIAALAGGHGGGGGGGSPPTSPPTPPPLTVTTSSLAFEVGGAPQSFNASEPGYSGPINAASNDITIATVSPSSGTGPGPVKFTVTPVGSGSTTILVTDNHGMSQTVSVTVTPPGAIMVNPSSLSFVVGGTSQPFTASESNYSGLLSATTQDATVATVSPASGIGPGPVTFNVTPVGPGTTKIKVTGGSAPAFVTITVALPGTIIVNPGSLNFLIGGASQTFTASEASYSGPLNAKSNDMTVATVSGSGVGPGPVTFTVSPVGAGTTTIKVTGGAAPAFVNITVIGPLTTNKTSLTFLGTTSPQDFTATDPFYTGTISASSGNNGVATVAPVGSTIGPGPVKFSVTPVAQGNTSITVTDTFGGSTSVSVSVSTGGLLINPTSLTFTVTGPSQQFNASESDYAGTIFAASSHPSQATVSPASGTGPGPVIFTVSPVSAGNPEIAVTDDHGGSKFVDITVTGPLSVNPPNLTFNGTTVPQMLNVADPNYFGSISASSSNVGVATVNSPLTGPSANFTVTPVNRGTAMITFSDANLASTIANITVNPGPLQVSTNSVSVTAPSGTSGFTASEVLYNGTISAVSGDNTIATISPASGPGPGPVSFTISGVGPGSTTVTVSDDHGGTQVINVTVTGAVTLSPPSVTFTDVGVANGTSITISDPGYHGAFTVTGDSCSGGVAVLGPISGNGPNATISVSGSTTTASGGTCQFSIKDASNDTSLAENVTVGPFGAINLGVASMTFTDVGGANAQSTTASETGYSGALTIDASACAGIATVSPASGPSGTSFTVTPVGSGSCNVNFNDDHTQSRHLMVTVGPFGSIHPSPSNFSFTDVGAGAAQALTVTENNYTGLFTIDASACGGIATVSPASSTGNFTVTPVASGGPCNLNITDDHNPTPTSVSVMVGPFGVVAPSTSSISLTVGGGTSNFTVNETGYTGNFTLDESTCTSNGAASVNPLSGNQSTTFTVTPGSPAGNCKIVVSDDHSQSAQVDIFVTAGALTVSPNTLTFATTSSPSQTFTADDPGAAIFNASSSNTLNAIVSPLTQLGPGPVTFIVSLPVTASVSQVSITVTDNLGGTAVVSIGVGESPLRKKRHPVTAHKGLPKPSPAPTHRAVPPIRGPVSPEPKRGLKPLVGPVARPDPTPAPSSGHAAPGPLLVSVRMLTVVVGQPGQVVAISEPGYAHAFSVTSANPAVATVNAFVIPGPSATLIVTPRSPGSTTIQITDDHGGLQTIQVFVRPAANSGHNLSIHP